MAIFLSIIILIALIFLIISLTIGLFSAPYVPSSTHAFKLIEEQNIIKDNMHIFELGSGDGKFMRYFYKRHDVAITGFEISPSLYILSNILNFIYKFTIKDTRVNRLKVKFQSYHYADFKNADIIYCYLLPKNLKDLHKYFVEMKKGSYIISLGFHIPNMELLKSIDSHEFTKKIYIYKIN